MNEEYFYNKVLEELRTNDPRPGLWAKAFADAQGDKVTTQALYLKYRVGQLADEEATLKKQCLEEEAAQKKKHLASLPFSQRFSDNEWYGLFLIIAGIAFILFFFLMHSNQNT